MPTYQYECEACDYVCEIWQSYDEEPAKYCPVCESPVHRVIFASPVHYKGAGFTTTEARGITGHKRKPKITVREATEEERKEQFG